MSNETMNQFAEQFTKALGPTRALFALNVGHFEKLTQLQLEAAKAYADLGIAQARGALQISDTQSFQDYVANQKDVAETVVKQINSDAQKVAEFGKAYAEEATNLVGQNARQAQAAAKQTPGKVTAKAGGDSQSA